MNIQFKDNKDILEILLAGGSGFTLMFANIEIVLKVLIGLVTLGYISWKWYYDIIDRNKKKK